MSTDMISKRTFLIIKACQAGANFWAAQEAIASTAMAQGWDMNELKTWEDWDAGDE